MSRKCKIKMLCSGSIHSSFLHIFSLHIHCIWTSCQMIKRCHLLWGHNLLLLFWDFDRFCVYLTSAGVSFTSAVNKMTISSLFAKDPLGNDHYFSKFHSLSALLTEIHTFKCRLSRCSIYEVVYVIQTLLSLILLDFLFSSIFYHFYKNLTVPVWSRRENFLIIIQSSEAVQQETCAPKWLNILLSSLLFLINFYYFLLSFWLYIYHTFIIIFCFKIKSLYKGFLRIFATQHTVPVTGTV